MKRTKAIRMLMGVTLVMVAACASTGSTPSKTAASPTGAGGGLRTAATSHCYTEADVARIEDLREGGEGLAAVAEAVGGTVDDVREVEQRLRVLRRHGSPGSSPPALDCRPVTVAP